MQMTHNCFIIFLIDKKLNDIINEIKINSKGKIYDRTSSIS